MFAGDKKRQFYGTEIREKLSTPLYWHDNGTTYNRKQMIDFTVPKV